MCACVRARRRVTVRAPPRAFWPSVSGPRCSSSCCCSWLRPLRPPPTPPRRIPPPVWPKASRTAAQGTSCTAHAPPGASAGDGARGPRRCPAAAAPAPERRRVARCNDYPTDAHVGREGRKYTLTPLLECNYNQSENKSRFWGVHPGFHQLVQPLKVPPGIFQTSWKKPVFRVEWFQGSIEIKQFNQ